MRSERIYTQWGKKKPTTPSEPGSRTKQEYIVDIDPKTRDKVLKPAGVTNIWEMIQAEKEQADINNIIAKASRGDFSGLKDKAEAIYGDFSKPRDLAQFMNIKLRAEKMWEQLPLEVRKAYDHDPEKYLMDYGSEKWLNLHGIELKKEETEVKEETKE